MPTETKTTRSRADSPSLNPRSADAFEHLAGAVNLLALAAPHRLSLKQMLAFTIIAQANAMGRSITITEVREIAGETLGQGIERQIGTFFEPCKQEPDAVGWLRQEIDEDDRRRKYLKLTDKGLRLVNEMTKALYADA